MLVSTVSYVRMCLNVLMLKVIERIFLRVKSCNIVMTAARHELSADVFTHNTNLQRQRESCTTVSL